MYTPEQGGRLVRAARRCIEQYVGNAGYIHGVEAELEGFGERRGVFVTLEDYPSHALRGCIGYPEAVGPMKKLVLDAAVCAAVEDPRFEPVTKAELGHIVISVSVLSELERMRGGPNEIKKGVRIGRDGLVIRYRGNSGLLLPAVATEEGWDAAQFLQNVCHKAGLPSDAWTHPDAVLYRFSAQVFKEKEPKGEIVETGQ